MKLFFIGIVLSLSGICNLSYSQEVINQPPSAPQPLTKIDLFISKSGSIVKFEDYNLPRLSQPFGFYSETRIRKVFSGQDVKFFYQISNTGKYGSSVASVELEDFNELKKSLIILKEQLNSDLKSPADYLENRFITEDGFRLGYFIDNKKATWFIKLDKYGSSSSITLKNIESLEESFKAATEKLNELK